LKFSSSSSVAIFECGKFCLSDLSVDVVVIFQSIVIFGGIINISLIMYLRLYKTTIFSRTKRH
jgi:hypothetical protein